MSAREARERVIEMLEQVRAIAQITAGGRLQFREDRIVRAALCWELLALTEAATHVPERVRARAPGIPWGEVLGMRTILAHEYVGVDPDAVWDTADTAVPALHEPLVELLAELEADPETPAP